MSPRKKQLDMGTWGQRLASRRIGLGLTQDGLADLTAIHGHPVTQQTISRVEADAIENPRYRTLEVLARSLGTDVATLFPQGNRPAATAKKATFRNPKAVA